MILRAAVLSAMFLFQPSPDPRVALDASGYICPLSERHVIEVACPPGQAGPCYGTSDPFPFAADGIYATGDPNMPWACLASDPMPGQIIMGGVAACLPDGHCSEAWGER